jgi:hypothetical protein
MGKLTISNKISGSINGAVVTSAIQQVINIEQASDVSLVVDNAWKPAANAGTSARTVVLINTGVEDALYRVLVGVNNYALANLPAGAAVLVYLNSDSQFLGDGTSINNKRVDVYSANGTTIRVGYFA